LAQLSRVSDAEDVVQEAFIRWMGVDPEEIREPDRGPQPANCARSTYLP
jgi:DNA-directed RNA polymerase specialized sigma24 family protein